MPAIKAIKILHALVHILNQSGRGNTKVDLNSRVLK